MPYYQDNHIRIFNKDCRDMSELPDESVQCVVTSPPYWGLRKYADLPDLVWGDNQCEHEWGTQIIRHDRGPAANSNVVRQPRELIGTTTPQGSFCSLCGAWKGQLGLEPTPEMFIQHLIEILREIRRVLRKDGVVFWNIGDSYWGGGRGADYKYSTETYEIMKAAKPEWRSDILKPKDLCLIPFRVAVATQEDGWWVRSVIIWSKSNPMPESVTDRPTESHEYILMLTKSGTPQYWTHRDGGGTRERPKADYRWVNQLTNEEVAIESAEWKEKIPCSDCNGTGKETAVLWGDYEVEIGKCPKCGGKGKIKLWRRINLWRGHDYYWDADAVREEYTEPMNRWGGDTLKRDTSKTATYKEMLNIGYSSAFRVGRPMRPNEAGRNIRTVWEFPTQPYPKAHFAVFPEKLPELCIKAATPEVGCCSKCGAPWERITKVVGKQVTEAMEVAGCKKDGTYEGQDLADYGEAKAQSPSNTKRRILESMSRVKESSWRPTCSCNADKVPSIVLDPFLGTGTTLGVAKKLGRRGVGYELSEAYCALSLERNRQQVMGL